MIYTLGKYAFLISYYIIENQQLLVSVYSLYDLTKFTFYVSDRMGIINYLKRYILNQQKKIIIIEYNIIDCELKNETDGYIDINIM